MYLNRTMKTNRETENQHYIPKFLLKNFTDSDGRVFCLNIKSNNITKPPPKHAGSDIAFYEFSDGGQVVSFEKKLQRIESLAAPVIRKIIKASSISKLTSVECDKISAFIAIQSIRTKAFREGLSFIDGKDMRETFEALLNSSFFTSAKIRERKWVLMKIENDGVFYLGDHPVVLQNTENPSKVESLGFDIVGIEAFLPLSPKLALYMPCRSISDEIILGYESGIRLQQNALAAGIHGKQLPGVNPAFIAQANLALDRLSGLYEAITKGTPIICCTENIENLNYLQCAWAHESVFSNYKDFTFAKHVLEKTPQYRETMKTSILQIGDMLIPK